MANKEVSTLSKRFTILVGLGVVSAMAFGLAVSFYRNVLFEETLKQLSLRNRDLRQTIDDEIQTLAYYQSRQYRDKYAKENLGKINAGENVLILTDDTTPFDYTSYSEPSRRQQRDAAYKEYLQKLPTIEHWKMYFFAEEKIQELKRSF